MGPQDNPEIALVSTMSESDKIFISIASYCDPLLVVTIRDAIANAKHPERLRFGVVEQEEFAKRMTLENEAAKHMVRYIGVDPWQSRGACWARALANTLHEGEEWFLQIDAHMHFESDWDTKLLQSVDLCEGLSRHARVLLTCYPNHFEWEGEIARVQTVTQKVLMHVLAEGAEFKDDDPVLMFRSIPVEVDHPVRGFHIAAGCLFGSARFLQEVPYDAQLYFHGEEQSLAVRAHTKGWDIWHPPAMPLYHYYDLQPERNERTKHWDESQNNQRAKKHWEFEQSARKRLRSLLVEGKDLGVYGLGNVRDIASFAALSGIDYTHQKIMDRARRGLAQQLEPFNTSSQEVAMNHINIDGKEYDPSQFNEQAKSSLQLLLATDQRIRELERDLVIARTARDAVAQALQANLPK